MLEEQSNRTSFILTSSSLGRIRKTVTAQSASSISKIIISTSDQNLIELKSMPRFIILKSKDYAIFIKNNGMELMPKLTRLSANLSDKVNY